MPVDFQSIHVQVQAWGEKAPQVARDLEQHRQQADQTLWKFSGKTDELCRLVERAVEAAPTLRCAQPVSEPLDTRCPLPATLSVATLLAADGSQVVPNPHGRVEYGVINVGVFQMCADLETAPIERKLSTLLGHERIYSGGSLITEDGIAMLRDLEERNVLVELARGLPAPVIALTDGPLEIFSEREYREKGEFRESFQKYLEVLLELSQLGAVAAGYVDRPRYDLVVRLLELAAMDPNDLHLAGKMRPFAGVRDRDLFAGLLAPGERSGIFRIQSSSARQFEGPLALHFFYLNVGRVGQPYLARVELPAWVAENPASVDLLHATLFYQSRLLGPRPYPYALHRAHEIAVVSYAEAEQLEQMLLGEMLRQGIYSFDESNKLHHKQTGGRTRHTL
jgi:hypothetical protein